MGKEVKPRPVANYNVMRYRRRMIRDFADRETERVWSGLRSRKLPADIQPIALRKLRLLNQARELSDLRVPPGNRLEAMKGDRASQFSIRINDQWRICFIWTEGGPAHVEIVDYHG
jgi:proteic killer suppression protein